MRATPRIFSIFLLSLALAIPALAQQSGNSSLSRPTIDAVAEEYQFSNAESGKPTHTLHALTAVVRDAKSGTRAAEAILDTLSPQQISQTAIVAEDPQVLKDLAARYVSARPTDQVPTFFPYGALANDKAAYDQVKGSRFGQIWNQARDWGKTQPIGKALLERYNYISRPERRIDALYYTVASGLSASGWIFVHASGTSSAHFNATIGTVSNLIFSQVQRVAFAVIPNRFSYATNWSTDRIRTVLGKDLSRPANKFEKTAGNFATQALINTISLVLRGADAATPILRWTNLDSVIFNSTVSTVTSQLSQSTYSRVEQLKEIQSSELEMTDFFLTRVNMVIGAITMFGAPTKDLQEFNHRAWIIQLGSIATWAVILKNIDHISEFAESSRLLKAYAKSELVLGQAAKTSASAVKTASGTAYDAIFRHDTSCLSLFGPRL